MQALEVRSVTASSDLFHLGEYAFVPKRHAHISFEKPTLTLPTGLLKRLWWNAFGRKSR
jgi:hypothetical protein